jgi:hypothetical protein
VCVSVEGEGVRSNNFYFSNFNDYTITNLYADSDSGGLDDLKFCISNRLPSEAFSAGSLVTFGVVNP